MPGWKKQPKIKVNVPKVARPRDFWSKDLTAIENFAFHGLAADPNDLSGAFTKSVNEVRKATKPKAKLPTRTIEDEIPKVPISTEKALPTHLPVYRVNQLEELIKRYGDNYQKMSIDKKYNYLQETARQLQKNVEEYLRYKSRANESAQQKAEEERAEENKVIETKKDLMEKLKQNMDFDENQEAEIIQRVKRKRIDELVAEGRAKEQAKKEAKKQRDQKKEEKRAAQAAADDAQEVKSNQPRRKKRRTE